MCIILACYGHIKTWGQNLKTKQAHFEATSFIFEDVVCCLENIKEFLKTLFCFYFSKSLFAENGLLAWEKVHLIKALKILITTLTWDTWVKICELKC